MVYVVENDINRNINNHLEKNAEITENIMIMQEMLYDVHVCFFV